jgi:hypothetical protein
LVIPGAFFYGAASFQIPKLSMFVVERLLQMVKNVSVHGLNVTLLCYPLMISQTWAMVAEKIHELFDSTIYTSDHALWPHKVYHLKLQLFM